MVKHPRTQKPQHTTMALPIPSTAMSALAMTVNRRIDTLIVADLQRVCRIENLQVSGKKADLQTRLKAKCNTYLTYGQEEQLRIFDERLQNPQSTSIATPFPFKTSPFFSSDHRLTTLHLPISKEHRNATTASFNLSQQDLTALGNVNVKVLLFAAPKLPSQPSLQPLEISFPQQLEIRVNDNEVKANTRGIKNKAGTTKPVDITPFIKKRSDVANRVTITYALTDKVFQVFVWLVKKKSMDDLKLEISKRVIRKGQTLADIRAKADDTDIITTSINMKLKDPVSFMRIQIPVRGSNCEHVGCFDLLTYLSMQEQAPQWECPLCSRKAPFSALAVDEYVEEILQQTSSSDEQVVIGTDGKWSRENLKPKSNGSGASAYQDDDNDSDDLIELSGPRPTTLMVKAEIPNTPSSMATPSVTGDAPRGQKRPSEVIDLTLSDDDNDEPLSKRPTLAHPGNMRQSSTQVNHSAANYAYNSHSPLSFSLSTSNSNLRHGTGSPSFRGNSPFNQPTSQFSRAISSLPGGAGSQPNPNTFGQNRERQPWSSGSHMFQNYSDDAI